MSERKTNRRRLEGLAYRREGASFDLQRDPDGFWKAWAVLREAGGSSALSVHSKLVSGGGAIETACADVIAGLAEAGVEVE